MAEAEIHPTAIVEDGARVGPGCRIGPYCVVGPEVDLAEGVVLHSHVVIAGHTRIGAATEVFPFASLGQPPQDFKWRGERTELVIGARNTLREYVTLSPGTALGGGITRMGDDNFLMMHSHVGHDCTLGSRIVMANGVSLSGHVTVGDGAILGGLAGVHQHVRIGHGAMVGGLAAVASDVVPYGMVFGDRAKLVGLNLVGLKRRGLARGDIAALRAAFDEMFEGEGALAERVRGARARHAGNPLVAEIADFVLAGSPRAITMPARQGRG
jgi:UDP-N-acetylglucosamine acyltransferase